MALHLHSVMYLCKRVNEERVSAQRVLLKISILVNTDMRLIQQCFVLVFMSDWAVCQQHRLVQILDLPQNCVEPVELLHSVEHVFIFSKASVLWWVWRLCREGWVGHATGMSDQMDHAF